MAVAYVCLVYTLACLIYMIGTRTMGTPFFDSLTSDQRDLYRQSARRRGYVFAVGLLFAIALVAVLRPFRTTP